MELTSKEFAVLELFLRNPNQVLSRTQIEEHIWDQGFVALSNVVEVYVGLLRRKLGDTTEPRLLETVRGVGYRLHDRKPRPSQHEIARPVHMLEQTHGTDVLAGVIDFQQPTTAVHQPAKYAVPPPVHQCPDNRRSTASSQGSPAE